MIDSRQTYRLSVLIAIGAVAGLGRLSHAEDDWPQFRGPTGQGLAAASADPPVNWGPTENVAWKTPIPGSGWSSPIVYRGRIYLTTALTAEDGRPTSLRAICVDAERGNIVFDREIFVPDGDAPKHTKNSHASSTPLAAGELVYFHFGHFGTACLALDGEIVWRQEAIDYPPVHGNGGSPVLAADKLIFNCDGGEDPFVVALHSSTGEVAWRTPRDTDAAKKFSFCTPLVISDGARDLIVSPGSGAVCAYDAQTGEEVWRVDYGEGYSVVPRPVLGDGLVYLSSGYETASVYAIRTGGRGDVT